MNQQFGFTVYFARARLDFGTVRGCYLNVEESCCEMFAVAEKSQKQLINVDSNAHVRNRYGLL
jgi:hypothetical protein